MGSFGTVDTFIGNNLIIDFDIYVLWVNGYTIDECVLNARRSLNAELADIDASVIRNDIIDNYLVFNKLEPLLQSPTRLKEQLLFQLTNDICDKLIEKYYEFNANVMREVVSCKLTQRQRKDLDDISDKTGVRVRSCRRQVLNKSLNLAAGTIEDIKKPLVKTIKENFLLSQTMAEQYSVIVFIVDNHFEISKRKLNHLSLEDFMFCAKQIIKNWSAGDILCDCELNKDFLIHLRDLKILIDRDYIDDHRKLVVNSIYTKNPSEYQLVDQSFKDLSKSLIDIAYTLNHSKDLKDLFIDLEEQVIELCKESNWSKNDVKIFLEEYRKCAFQIDELKRNHTSLLNIFDRYIQTLTVCILQMYHS